MRQLVAYGKQLTVTPKKWSQSLTEGGRLLEVNCKALTGKIWSFGLAVAHGGSTVLGLLEYKPPSPHCE